MRAARTLACAPLGSGLIANGFGLSTEIPCFGATLFVGIENGSTPPPANAGILPRGSDPTGDTALPVQ